MDRRHFVGAGIGAMAAPLVANVAAAATGRRASSQFPRNFLWGTATAAHQVEGQNTNCDYWVLEQIEGSPFVDKSGDACDHYHRYAADIAMMAQAHLNAYRFSIEWARIEPEEGQFSRAALDHYRRMLSACRENGIAPIVTFQHFTSPIWLAKLGGWTVPETADRFARYCEVATRHLGDLISVGCTINELNYSSLLDGMNFIPVERRVAVLARAARHLGTERFEATPLSEPTSVARTVIAAHRKGRDAIKSGPGDFPVGLTISMTDFYAVDGGEARLREFRAVAEDQFLEAARGDDFVGVQAYTRGRIGPNGFMPPEAGTRRTQMGYDYWPQSTEACARRAHAVTGNRIIVTESGIGTDDDNERIAYIDETMTGIQRCLADGIPIDGYIHWSFIDNFEWTNGYAPKFGLVACDRETFARTPKPSLAHLSALARRNGPRRSSRT